MNKDVLRLGGIAAVLLAVGLIVAGYFLRQQKDERAAEAAKRPAPETDLFVRPHSRSLGPADAKVTIVEFLDPECESCRAMHPMVKRLLSDYGGRLRLVLRYMPMHGNSVYAAGALEAAGEQGRFWELLEVLFQHQPEWGDHHAPKPELIPQYARQVGLDMAAFERAMSSGKHQAIVATDRADGQKLGVTGTPTFFVNKRPLARLGYEELKAMVDEELAK